MEAVANHPNAWFRASVEYHKLKTDRKNAGGQTSQLTAGSEAKASNTALEPVLSS